ncbi:PqqD family protein [Rothia aerolata]|uniref:PqqD family protein n=1 Tax=Rothia aerolata TaxID=1812262 RepID=A0A917IT22_9MICC|nr:PqqD family protein [Rothia aerolata]GGH63006.1 hypothetical protein GCM10007359_13840 [Rothia aerolata]
MESTFKDDAATADATRYSHAPSTAYVYESEMVGANADSSTIFVCLLETSEILRLDAAGGLIWEILAQPATAEQVVAEVASVFQESEDTVRQGVLDFIASLLHQKLIIGR